MTTHSSAPQIQKFKRMLRCNLTGPEQKLWFHLRGRNLLEYKFRRQHGIGMYIVDFYCPEKKLVIEVDGDSHNTVAQKQKDRQRDQDLHRIGCVVLRFTNEQVLTDLEGVLLRVVEQLSRG